MRFWITGLLVAVAAFSLGILFLSGTAPGQPVEPDAPPLHAQRLARMVSSYELLKYHFSIWESDEAHRELAMEMCDAFAQQTDVGVTWTARHFGSNSTSHGTEPDEFEERSIRRLRDESSGMRELWSSDRTYPLPTLFCTCTWRCGGRDTLKADGNGPSRSRACSVA